MKLAVIVSVFIALLVIATIVDNTPTPTSIASKPAWTTYASKDEMTGARQAFAFSRNVTAITRMTFPSAIPKRGSALVAMQNPNGAT